MIAVAALLLVIAALAAVLVGIVGAIAGASPGGLTPRTMDAAASWRA